MGALVFSLTASALVASEFADLKRLVPVPAGEQIPIIDFARPIALEQVQLNHTGTQVAAIIPGDNDHTNLITYELATQKMDGIGAPRGDRDIYYFMWLDANRLSYLISEKKIIGRHIMLSEAGKLATSEEINAAGAQGSTAFLASTPEDRSQLLVNLSGYYLRYDHPELINVANHGTMVVRYPELKTDHGFDLGFHADKLGKLAYGITQEDGILALNKLVGESWEKCPEDLDQVTFEGAGDNPGDVVVLGHRDGVGPRALQYMDASSGKAGEVILQDKGYDFDGWLFHDPLTHNIVGAIYDRAAPHVAWFSEAYRSIQKAVDHLFPDQIVRIVEMDDSGKVMLIRSGSDRQPAIYSWVNLETHKSGLVANSAPWIDPKRMQPMGIIKYTTAEGRQMDAYITLPAGASKKNPPPMVVIPHSFSGGRWVWGFDAEVQFLASRGYAVLQPNYRGSAGYTWMYPEEEDWDFRKMSDDVARAARKAIEMGLVDANRVAIMGTSFGGYLAAAGAAFEPGLYKCALSLSGTYDWGKYISDNTRSKFSDPSYSRYLHKLGDPKTYSDRYNDMSPLPHASQIHSALFLAWGEYDDAELISQAKDLASAVGKNGMAVETESFLDEGAGVRHLTHKIELYEHVEAFLSKNL